MHSRAPTSPGGQHDRRNGTRSHSSATNAAIASATCRGEPSARPPMRTSACSTSARTAALRPSRRPVAAGRLPKRAYSQERPSSSAIAGPMKQGLRRARRGCRAASSRGRSRAAAPPVRAAACQKLRAVGELAARRASAAAPPPRGAGWRSDRPARRRRRSRAGSRSARPRQTTAGWCRAAATWGKYPAAGRRPAG